jgi:hypothetical protein
MRMIAAARVRAADGGDPIGAIRASLFYPHSPATADSDRRAAVIGA